jgi:hypothetical protein
MEKIGEMRVKIGESRFSPASFLGVTGQYLKLFEHFWACFSIFLAFFSAFGIPEINKPLQNVPK